MRLRVMSLLVHRLIHTVIHNRCQCFKRVTRRSKPE